MSIRTKTLKIALPFIIIIFAAGIMAGLMASRKPPEKTARKDPGALVRVIEVKKEDHRVRVRGTGTVQAARVVTLIPEVSGLVERVARGLVAGGFFKKGQLLCTIEKSDYRLDVERAEAARIRAEYQLTKIRSQAEVARRQWERINRDDKRQPNPLVLYVPQLKDAEASLKSTEAALEQAKLNLKRTELRAPFNCRVSSEELDAGQFVRAGTPVAVLTGTDEAEIDVPLSLDELQWLTIPRGPGDGGAEALVTLKAGGKEYRWKGRIVRSLGEVDPKDRMTHVVVSVKDPYGLKVKDNKRPPLSIGAFVEVSMEGSLLTGVFSIPRRALRDGSVVWTVDGENRLRIKKVKVVRLRRDVVLLRDGFKDGDRVVLTTLSGVADGMLTRPQAVERD
ncbi:MAG: efflux RND transporter periplasmic adaptor subunit [Thermodesulfobacteriota bacterium]